MTKNCIIYPTDDWKITSNNIYLMIVRHYMAHLLGLSKQLCNKKKAINVSKRHTFLKPNNVNHIIVTNIPIISYIVMTTLLSYHNHDHTYHIIKMRCSCKLQSVVQVLR